MSDSGSPEKPVFLVSYCHEVTDPYQSLELAVWRSGRVIWRIGKAGRSASDSSVWIKGKYFEGRIPPERVRTALRQFQNGKLLGRVDLETGIWPTSSPSRIEITDGDVYSRFVAPPEALARWSPNLLEVGLMRWACFPWHRVPFRRHRSLPRFNLVRGLHSLCRDR